MTTKDFFPNWTATHPIVSVTVEELITRTVLIVVYRRANGLQEYAWRYRMPLGVIKIVGEQLLCTED